MGFMNKFPSKVMSNGLFTATTEVRNVDDEEEEGAVEEVVILRPQSALSGIGAPTRIPVSAYFHQRGFVKFELALSGSQGIVFTQPLVSKLVCL